MASFIKRYLKVYKDGETVKYPIYSSNSSTYFDGTTAHYIKIYKNGQTFNLPLKTDGDGCIKTSIDGTTYKNGILTPKSCYNYFGTRLQASGGDYYFTAHSSSWGSYLRSHSSKFNWYSIYYKDNWGISHQYTQSGGVVTVSGNSSNRITLGYQCRTMQSGKLNFEFSRSSQDYSYVTYKLSAWWGDAWNWSGTSSEKSVTSSSLNLEGGTVTGYWTVNITEGD